MSSYLERKLEATPSPSYQMSLMMSTLLLNRKIGPEAMGYFADHPMPLWFETLSHQTRDLYIFPIVQTIVKKGILAGEFDQACDDLTVELIYRGITQLVHTNYTKLEDLAYLRRTINSIEYILNMTLGTTTNPIKISEVTYEKTSEN
jgi:hypothetical protein